ncbi:MAG: hypothetical protein DRQ47_07155 [Gammaproteobacteria bacterium]|nr:MAG: hypothetical protein DRQ47_07155 [Gammaproteobacteria bacterium]
MPTAADAKLQYESGQTSYSMEKLTDIGDAITFESHAVLFSNANTKEPNVKPDGLASGGVVVQAISNTDDMIDVAALTCYLAGVKTTVPAAADETIVRATADAASISSITINSTGNVVIVKGTDSVDTNFSEVRDAAGGPPYIPVGSIEVGQVRTTSNAAAKIDPTEIFQVIGLHQERYNSPIWTINSQDALVVMDSALQDIHTGGTTKSVNASYADPLFSDIAKSENYVPSETSHTVNSKQIYGTTIGSAAKSLNQGTFTAYVEDGITDPLIKAKDDNLWFKFFPNRYKSDYILDQGLLGVSRTFPAGDSLAAACTISSTEAAVGVEA